jgi:hypothetical protein
VPANRLLERSALLVAPEIPKRLNASRGKRLGLVVPKEAERQRCSRQLVNGWLSRRRRASMIERRGKLLFRLDWKEGGVNACHCVF